MIDPFLNLQPETLYASFIMKVIVVIPNDSNYISEWSVNNKSQTQVIHNR